MQGQRQILPEDELHSKRRSMADDRAHTASGARQVALRQAVVATQGGGTLFQVSETVDVPDLPPLAFDEFAPVFEFI